MTDLHWPLSVLSRCIDYRNLTSASQHVGISQPQLSRIVKQIEEELGVLILDRSSPRHSTWTPEARGLAHIYSKSEKNLQSEFGIYLDGTQQKEIKIGCLEGLSGLAKASVSRIFEETYVEQVTLNLYDLNQLEAKFLSAELDIAFTSRTPGRKKYIHEKVLGFQTFEKTIDRKSNVEILSSYEAMNSKTKRGKKKQLVSNSLAVRRTFANVYGGSISIPSEVGVEGRTKASVDVLVLAQDHLSKKIWKTLV